MAVAPRRTRRGPGDRLRARARPVLAVAAAVLLAGSLALLPGATGGVTGGSSHSATPTCTKYGASHDASAATPETVQGRVALVTGGAGFIGSHVAAECLRLGMQVVIVDDLSGGFKANVPVGADLLVGDIKDDFFLEELFGKYDFDYVYHVAAYAAEGLSHFIRTYNYRNNLVSSVSLVNFAVKKKVRCFVFTSSIAVYGAGQVPFDERTVPQPEDPYGVSKYAVEMDLKAAHEMFGLQYLIFRPHNVYGPGQNMFDKYRNVVGFFLNQLSSGQPLTIFGNGEQTRKFSYVDNVAIPLARSVMYKGAYNQVFNIGGDTASSLNTLAQAVKNAWGSDAETVHLPPRLEVEHAESRHKKLQCFFPAAALPATVGLDDGLNKMVQWVRTTGKFFDPVVFKSVEVLEMMPASWVTPEMKQVARVEHTAEDNVVETGAAESRSSTVVCRPIQRKLVHVFQMPHAMAIHADADLTPCDVLSRTTPVEKLPDLALKCPDKALQVFSSCKVTGVAFSGTNIQGTKVKADFQLFSEDKAMRKKSLLMPGLGLERRDFSQVINDKGWQPTSWGDGTKRLTLSVTSAKPRCGRTLHGLTYVAWAFHPFNLGHFMETLFRIVVELHERSELEYVKQILIINVVDKELPFRPFVERIFPGTAISTLKAETDGGRSMLCLDAAVYVGWPNSGFGRRGTPPALVQLFHDHVLGAFGLGDRVHAPPQRKPRVVFLSRKGRKYGGRAARRYLENEEALMESIRKRTGWDVQIAMMEELSFEQQVELMQGTSLLVAMHTAGLYNVLYMEAGGAILQVNVPGTHFGTYEYEDRPQEPLWMNGMWHTPVQGLCDQRGVLFLESWASPDPSHALRFRGDWPKLSEAERKKAYAAWAGADGKGWQNRWKQCAAGTRPLAQCKEDISNEMRAHSVADALTLPEDALWAALEPHLECIEHHSCEVPGP